MDKTDPYDITRAIVALNPWERASRHNWALVPQTSAEPFIVTAVDERKDPGPVAGRLLLFPGFTTFRDFVITRQMKDYGVAMGPMDFRHYEAVGLKNGDVEIFVYEPGYVPVSPTSEDRKLLAPLLHECYGLLLRVEEKPDLPLAYVEKKAMFARKEVVDGVWIDGPFILPEEEVIQQLERVELAKEACAKAKALPVFPKEIWEVDFVMIPSYHTPGPHPRFLYLLCAVNAESGERMVWERMSVDGKEDGLKRMWESHAQKLLDGMIKWGRVPGQIHVRSGRVMRFVRPLGLQLPFKLVRHEKLPSLDGVLNLAVQTRKV
ncbi:MAG: hypothetical protein Q4G65_06915 [bacterium]|nr:hypothetical protein [bacterium]